MFNSNIINDKISNYDDLKKINSIFDNFLHYKNIIELNNYEATLRHNIINNSMLNYIYSNTNLFNTYNTNNLYNKLLVNYNILYNNFKQDFSNIYNNYYVNTDIINFDNSFNNNIITNTGIFYNYSNLLLNDINNSNYIFNNNYNTNREKIYNNDYKLNTNNLLINSYKSNSIVINFDVIYNSFLYNTINIGKILLDISIPDIILPTIKFKNNNYDDISLNQNLILEDNINILINNIEYIDLNESYINLVNEISYNTLQEKLIDEYKIININTAELYNTSDFINNSKNIEISYTIKDNANNVNNIIQNIKLIEANIIRPQLVYDNSLINTSRIETPFTLNVNETIDVIRLTDLITINDFNTNGVYTSLGNTNNFSIKFKINKNIINLEALSFVENVDYIVENDYIDAIKRNVIAPLFNTINTSNSIIYQNAIKYYYESNNQIASQNINNLFLNYIEVFRDIRIIDPNEEIEEIDRIKKVCCYPKVLYKDIQHKYKLGSLNSTAMKRTKFIINNHI